MERTWSGDALTIGPTGDAILVERARSGERDAFDALVRGRVDSVYRTALAILGEDADAADVVQETFVSAWRKLGDLRDVSTFDAWLARITLNACRSQLRLRRRQRVREVRVGDDGDAFGDDRTASGVDERAADADAFDRAFARLDVEARSILVLHHLEERPVAEIAAILRVPEGTVKSRLHRARAALEAALAKESR